MVESRGQSFFSIEKNPSAGNKAKGLSELVGQNYPVPPFAVIPEDFMIKYLAPVSRAIDELWQKPELEPQQLAAALQELLLPLIPPADTLASVAELLDSQPEDSLWALRSSSALEDDQEHSFAGQFCTVLRVRKQQLLEQIKFCWDQSFSPYIIGYCRSHGLKPKDICLSLVIQQFLEAEFSGVLFTANPLGILNEQVIVVGASTGEGVVEDKVPVTTYYRSNTDGQSFFQTESGAPLLNPDPLTQLWQAGASLGKDGWMDVEFAFYQKQLFFLQKRPITSLKSLNQTILDNSNIVESYPGITLPLTASFAREAYSGVFTGLARRCLFGGKKVSKGAEGRGENPLPVTSNLGEGKAKGYPKMLGEMVDCVNGRMYYRISNWYQVLRFLPLQKKIIPVWQKMMGVSEKTVPTELAIPFFQRLGTGIKIGKAFGGLPKKLKKLHQNFQQLWEDFQRTDLSQLSNEELIQLYQRLKSSILADWDLTLLNDLVAFISTAMVQRAYRRKDAITYKERANQAIGGEGNLASLKPLLALVKLAERIRALPEWEDKFQHEPWENILTEYPWVSEAIEDYIYHYGDRCPEELKLESPTFRSDRELFIKTLSGYVMEPASGEALLALCDQGNILEVDRQAVDQASFSKSRKKASQNPASGFWLKKAQAAIAARELSRLDRSRIYGMVRSIFTVLGSRLEESQQINSTRDVFYLETSEVFEALSNGTVDLNLKALVRKRQRQYEGFAKLPPFSRLVFAQEPFDRSIPEAVQLQGKELQREFFGTSVSPGRIEGEVLLVKQPSQIETATGKIIVAAMTDPGWVFLLATAKGIISEKGSLLSHTAIMARELSIPAVVGVKGILDQLESGQRIILDATEGYIEVIDT